MQQSTIRKGHAVGCWMEKVVGSAENLAAAAAAAASAAAAGGGGPDSEFLDD